MLPTGHLVKIPNSGIFNMQITFSNIVPREILNNNYLFIKIKDLEKEYINVTINSGN